MKISLKAAAIAALAASAIAGSANAAVNVSYTSDNLSLPAGQVMVWDFDGLEAAGYSTATSGAVNIYNGADGLMSGISAPPPGDLTNYVAVLGGGSLTLTTPAIKLLSVYMGSPDAYNSIRFNFSDNTSELLSGTQLAGGVFFWGKWDVEAALRQARTFAAGAESGYACLSRARLASPPPPVTRHG